MRQRLILSLIIIGLLAGLAAADDFSLSHLYRQGKTLLDEDGDGLGEKIALSIIIPDKPLPEELALAADLAARINLESLELDFKLVYLESEIKDLSRLKNPVLIGNRLKLAGKILAGEKIDPAGLKAGEGLVAVFNYRGQQGLVCLAGTPETLLRTGRAFFLRWPYFWEIWGRESGYTYQRLEKDLKGFLEGLKVKPSGVAVTRLLYTFPPSDNLPASLNSLDFEAAGEIAVMTVKLDFSQFSDLERVASSLRQLSRQRNLGQNTEVLAYPACACLEFILNSPGREDRVSLPRPGSSRRLLTPLFKEIPRIPDKPRQFDLTEVFSTKGFYADRNGDGITDGIETAVIIPTDYAGHNLPLLATRLVLDTAGSSFPLVYLDKEIDSPKALVAPILVSSNALTRDLLKKGKLKTPELNPGLGLIKILPSAPGSSDSLLITASSAEVLDKTLAYFGQKFPYLTDFKKGEPEISLLKEETEKFLQGKNGAAEAYFQDRLAEEIKKIAREQPENLEVAITLPEDNPGFGQEIESYLKKELPGTGLKVTVETMNQTVEVLSKTKEWVWEADEALGLLREKLDKIPRAESIMISLGLSESPAVREKVRRQVEELARSRNLQAEVEVLSAYKPGFFWLTESVLPRLKNLPVHRVLVRFAEVQDQPQRKIKRFYGDPNRWLQELYPVDEILAAELRLPIENIQFEKKPAGGPIYEAQAFDLRGQLLWQGDFSPQTREIPFLRARPDWGTVTITTGWCRVSQKGQTWLEAAVQTDPEKFWDFYQDEILKPLQDFVLQKTGHEPTFAKQPYFKRLAVELWLSEPDYRLGLDQEIISSLEALHDEIYFDTLDFLRAITGWTEEDLSLPADASRSSAPGNVLPVIHPSTEGRAPRASFRLEDFRSKQPRMTLSWTSGSQPPARKVLEFSPIKTKSLRLDELVYDPGRGCLESAGLSLQMEKESDYTLLASILDSFCRQREKRTNVQFFALPGVSNLKIRVQYQDLSLEKTIPIVPGAAEPAVAGNQAPAVDIPSDRIIGPEECLRIASSLSRYPAVRSYVGGYSYERRPVPVLEIYLPAGRYVSLPRLITFKPVLHLTARQHANEVSATNYSLQFAELLASDPDYQDFLKRFSVVIQPMENPDGAALALDLWKDEPFHSLHAGRYSSLGVDIGYQVGLGQPLLPEARVRARLNRDWVPDIYLNLHGYPSHEWVQMFSGYSPYLFRDYWIPKGWFTYFRQLSLDIYRPYREAAEELKKIMIEEMNSMPGIRDSNLKFYSRYDRWARRWSPFVSPLEIYDGLNIFARRQSPTENRLNQRSQMTPVEQTPEVMDETATGSWLDFLCRQGLAYLRAHAKYLAGLTFDMALLEEEVQNRIRVEFHRRRPGTWKK
ncbi:MAG: M14 family metallopeptidase [Candidatus Saccharicenans sp.]|nr:M14 family metallopeptidase [Candidatus Saccharicenans sp.]